MSVERRYYVYIMASKRKGTLYIGVSQPIINRVWEHKNDVLEGFTKKYGVHMLVWYESFEDVHLAIAREKQLKGWNRDWKIKLIERMNPRWDDLYEKLVEGEGMTLDYKKMVAEFNAKFEGKRTDKPLSP
jgi:putative endonuclease